MKETMYDIFNNLDDRVLDALDKTDLEMTRFYLSNLKENTLCSGVGGSHVVSDFASLVLEHKNNIIATNIEPRDILYKNINNYKNILVCSYGGRNYGVDIAFNNDLNKYLLARSVYKNPDVKTIHYRNSYDIERSFISLDATIIPMTILLDYYMDGKIDFIKNLFKENDLNIEKNKNYEIISGIDNSTPTIFLESTLVESGIGNVIKHDKYDYCHGRSNLSYNYDNNLIYFNSNKELDKVMLDNLNKYYDNILIISKESDDIVINNYIQTVKAMYLCKNIAHDKNIDLANINYSPMCKKLYPFRGTM